MVAGAESSDTTHVLTEELLPADPAMTEGEQQIMEEVNIRLLSGSGLLMSNVALPSSLNDLKQIRKHSVQNSDHHLMDSNLG